MDEKVHKIVKKSKKKFRIHKSVIIVAIIIFTGLISQLYLPNIIVSKIFENFKLQPESTRYLEWKYSSPPADTKIYIFNWTNPEEISDRLKKPKFQQLGPYKFDEYHSKHNISFHNENSTISYSETTSYFFRADSSNGSFDDMLNVLNLLAISAATSVHHLGTQKQVGLSNSLNSFNHQIHVSKSVKEMLFDGYSDIMVTLGVVLADEASNFEKIGFLVKRNGSDLKNLKYTINSGLENLQKLGHIEKLNELEKLPYFKGDCRNLKGSVDDLISINSVKDDILYVFMPDLCRSIPFEYHKDVTINGILGRRFMLNARAIDNGTMYHENLCYYNDPFPSGVINISACNAHQPYFVSYPHFYLADPSFGSAVDGMSPNQELHQSYITIEPSTGTILESVIRLQTNVLVRKSETISIFKRVPDVLIPLYFMDRNYSISESNFLKLRFSLMVIKCVQYVGHTFLIIGLLTFSVLRIHCYLHNKNKNQKNSNDFQLLVN